MNESIHIQEPLHNRPNYRQSSIYIKSMGNLAGNVANCCCLSFISGGCLKELLAKGSWIPVAGCRNGAEILKTSGPFLRPVEGVPLRAWKRPKFLQQAALSASPRDKWKPKFKQRVERWYIKKCAVPPMGGGGLVLATHECLSSQWLKILFVFPYFQLLNEWCFLGFPLPSWDTLHSLPGTLSA